MTIYIYRSHGSQYLRPQSVLELLTEDNVQGLETASRVHSLQYHTAESVCTPSSTVESVRTAFSTSQLKACAHFQYHAVHTVRTTQCTLCRVYLGRELGVEGH